MDASVNRLPQKNFSLRNMKICSIIFLLLECLLILLPVEGSHKENTYPEEVHQLVLEKLGQIRGHSGQEEIGIWGDWSLWSPCSRSCGTGVSTQHRECQPSKRESNMSPENSTKFGCVGRFKRFQLCNTQLCPEGIVDFRAEQCASFNKTPFNKRVYIWDPFIDSIDSCTLNCRAAGLSFYATLNQSVVDGTPCGGFQPRITGKIDRFCVEGKCVKVGCDGLLGSGRTLDACGVCGGDNTTCRVISGVYSRPNLPFGYNLIATLPPGAINLSIYHLKPSTNYLALRELGGNYILNGPWGMNLSGSFEASGTTFTYSRPHTHGGDHLYATGPTTHSLDVMLFFQNKNPGIHYEYRLPMSSGKVLSFQAPPSTYENGKQTSKAIFPVLKKSSPQYLESSKLEWDQNQINSKSNKKTKTKLKKDQEIKYVQKSLRKSKSSRHVWVTKGFTECSRTCGGGTQTTRIVCTKHSRKGVEVPPHFCANIPPPVEQVINCNFKPCPPQWEATAWSECSVTCGLGVQVRKLVCKQKSSADDDVLLSNDECGKQSSLTTAQVCQMRDCDGPPSWDIGSWTACSSQCGLGTRRRKVTCTTVHGRINEEHCKEPKPTEEEMCDMGSCAPDTWFFSSWDETCRGPCGNGVQKRRLYCSGNLSEGKKLSLAPNSGTCSKKVRPTDQRNCVSEKECGGSWFTGPWTDCDVRCGLGRQRRAVACITWHRGRYKVTKNEDYCKGAGARPEDVRSCAVDCQAEWFTSEWSECSLPCDGGVQRREIKCLNHLLQPSMECSSSVKPDSRQYCNTHSCKKKDERLKNEVIQPSKQYPNDSSSYPLDVKTSSSGACMDRMKNCHLVFKARLCKLKYYNKLCCETCS